MDQHPDWKEVAAQLRCPSGEMGIETGRRMQESNMAMICTTIDEMQPVENEEILELGFSNGSHLNYLMRKAKDIRYCGIELSETMLTEASSAYAAEIHRGTISIRLGDGIIISFPDDHFDKIFTVNTLYFWKDPEAYAKEIHRVLRPGGKFCLAFGEKRFMEALPFTSFGFTLYDAKTVKELLQKAGFIAVGSISINETIVRSQNGETAERTYIIVTAMK